MENTINLNDIQPGKLIPLAHATLDMLQRFLRKPNGRDLLEKKKAELRERGVI